MTPNPILKVLFTLKEHHVKCLLIGGQACIIYGAAEFSRDSDFIILSTLKNIKCLKEALKSLKAELLYVPPMEVYYLERGHACHFRCKAKGVEGLRIDVISKLRGCEPFDKLWERRKTITLKEGNAIDVIGLKDLTHSKKTQRDKDWLMLKRLLDNDIILNNYVASQNHIKWWFQECRDPNILIKLTEKYPKIAKELVKQRVLISFALRPDKQKLNQQFHNEEMQERQKDIEYWKPLRKELEVLRRRKLK